MERRTSPLYSCDNYKVLGERGERLKCNEISQKLSSTLIFTYNSRPALVVFLSHGLGWTWMLFRLQVSNASSLLLRDSNDCSNVSVASSPGAGHHSFFKLVVFVYFTSPWDRWSEFEPCREHLCEKFFFLFFF